MSSSQPQPIGPASARLDAPGEDPQSDRRRRLELTGLAQAGHPGLCGLVSRVGPRATAATLRGMATSAPMFGRLAGRLPEATAGVDAQLLAAEAVGARYLCPGDPHWPAQLDVLADVGVQGGHGGPPVGLWVRGRLEALAEQAGAFAVAVVGSRAATDYGLYVAGELGAGLAERGVRVVSGAAYGIDGAAQRGALAAGGVTVAVLAGGVDVPYPRSNAGLLERIVDSGGAVVSEAPLGARATRRSFLARNRLIAALCRGTVVVEAAIRSGTTSTAGWADRCSRHVMAVPGPVTSALSAGTHRWIRDRNAVLVTDAPDVLRVVGDLGTEPEDDGVVASGPDDPRDGLSLEAAVVLDALPHRRPVELAELAAATGLTFTAVLARLTELDVAGLVRRTSQGWTPALAGVPDAG